MKRLKVMLEQAKTTNAPDWYINKLEQLHQAYNSKQLTKEEVLEDLRHLFFYAAAVNR